WLAQQKVGLFEKEGAGENTSKTICGSLWPDRGRSCTSRRHGSPDRNRKRFHILRRRGRFWRRKSSTGWNGPVVSCDKFSWCARYGDHQCAHPRLLGHRQG